MAAKPDNPLPYPSPASGRGCSSLPEWLAYIQTLHPKTIALGLDRVQTVADRLQVRHFSCPVITIAGTNGKGSCLAFLEAILQSAGYRVGAYTSPHLLRFNERIRIAGVEAADQAIAAALAEVEMARAETALTYFEFTTLAALLLFQRAELDVVLLEVGLGGRLDAVNIIAADIAIVTTIAMDHMDYLGDSREAIAAEKAGIFRAGKPAVCGDVEPPALIELLAAQIGAPLYCINRDFFYRPEQFSADDVSDTWEWQDAEEHFTGLPLTQLPRQNAATALMAIRLLQTILPIPKTAIYQGLAAARVPGRFQQLPASVPVILDVAHNPAAAQWLAQRWRQQFPEQTGRTLAVVGMLTDKDIAGTLQPLLPCVDLWCVAGIDEPRGASADIIGNYLQDLGVAAYYTSPSVLEAWQTALSLARPEDRILVFGSFHTVAPVLHYLKKAHYGTQT